MMRLASAALVAVSVTALALGCARAPAAERTKYLIILQAGKETHEGLARALHALLYTRELKAHGHDVVPVFVNASLSSTSTRAIPASPNGSNRAIRS